MLSSRLMSGVAFSALAVALSAQAFAQSTGTQEVEKVTVTGQRNGTGGVIIKEQRPKTRSTVTQGYLKTQPGGQTVFQLRIGTGGREGKTERGISRELHPVFAPVF